MGNRITGNENMSFIPIDGDSDEYEKKGIMRLRCLWDCHMVRIVPTKESMADTRLFIDKRCEKHVKMLQKSLGTETWEQVMKADREQWR